MYNIVIIYPPYRKEYNQLFSIRKVELYPLQALRGMIKRSKLRRRLKNHNYLTKRCIYVKGTQLCSIAKARK